MVWACIMDLHLSLKLMYTTGPCISEYEICVKEQTDVDPFLSWWHTRSTYPLQSHLSCCSDPVPTVFPPLFHFIHHTFSLLFLPFYSKLLCYHPFTIPHVMIHTISSFYLNLLSPLLVIILVFPQRATVPVQLPCRPAYVTTSIECLFGFDWQQQLMLCPALDFSEVLLLWLGERKRCGSVRRFSLQRKNQRPRGNRLSSL